MKLRVIALATLSACLLLSTSAQAHIGYVAYDPCCAPPVIYTSYYAPLPAAVYSPAVVVRSRYRPLLGGTVARTRVVASPVVYAPCCW